MVDDDLLIGLRFLEKDVPTQGDSLLRTSPTAYLDGSGYSAVQHDLRKPKEEMLLKRVRESHADAVILAAAKMCEPGLDEQVTYSKTLEEAGIPHFVTEFEEKMSGFDQMQMQLETFVESILFD